MLDRPPRRPSPWLHLALGAVAFVLAGAYLLKILEEGATRGRVIPAIVWAILGILWLCAFYRARMAVEREAGESDSS